MAAGTQFRTLPAAEDCLVVFSGLYPVSAIILLRLKNLELTNVNISGASYASGGMCAFSTTSFCTFSNCAVNGGSISGSSNVGGIAGYAASASQVSGKSNFNNCYVNADVSASGGWAGGICGRVQNSVSISSCYASGTVSGGSSIGGLTGSCGTAGNSVIQNSFALQSAITYTNGARVAGAKNPGDQLSSCYAWQDMAVNGNTVSSADPTSIDGASITATQALSGATYSALSWDSGIWTLTDNDKLPFITSFGPVDTALYTYLTATPAVKLSTPTGLAWDGTTPGKATWSAVANASSYTVQLLKDGVMSGSAVTGVTATEYDYTSAIAAAGTGGYTFTVTAIGDGTNYTDSDAATAGTAYSYTSPAVKLSTPTGTCVGRDNAGEGDVERSGECEQLHSAAAEGRRYERQRGDGCNGNRI